MSERHPDCERRSSDSSWYNVRCDRCRWTDRDGPHDCPLGTTTPPPPAVDEVEHFIQAAIDRAPDQFRRLGEYLGNALDEDQFATAERMLLGAAEAAAQVAARAEKAEAEVARLKAAMKLADLQYMGAGGNLRPEEVVSAMRSIIDATLSTEGGE